MRESQYELLTKIRTISRVSVLLCLGLALILEHSLSGAFGWQVGLAIAALIVGIPHGAVDHLIAVPNLFSAKMALFLVVYLSVTALAIGFLLSYPLLGFQLIVFISALHFGVGDTSFHMEIYRRSQAVNFPKVLYIFSTGFTPVFLPLVNSKTSEALNKVNSKLVDWAGGFAHQILIGIVALNLVTVSILLIRKLYWPTIDLCVLFALALYVQPLVAFAIYFGLWHAIRHTARLTLDFQPSLRDHELGKPWKSFWSAVRAGLPAVVIVLVFTSWLAISNRESFTSNYLWYLLVVTWALTVPHMALTARSDIKALRNIAE